MSVDPAVFYMMLAFVAFLIGLAKGGFGGMLGSLATPLLALVMPADQVIGLVLPILMVADLFAVAMHWRRWQGRLILLLLPGAIVGVTIGTLFITNAPTEALRLALGVIVLTFAVFKLFEKRVMKNLQYVAKNWHGLLAGTVTGFSSALAHTGAPPVSIYLLTQQVAPQVFIGTSVLFFFILNWIKVPYYLYADLFDFERILKIFWVLPVVLAGAFYGRWLSDRFKKETFEKVIVGFLIVAAIMLIFT